MKQRARIQVRERLSIAVGVQKQHGDGVLAIAALALFAVPWSGILEDLYPPDEYNGCATLIQRLFGSQQDSTRGTAGAGIAASAAREDFGM